MAEAGSAGGTGIGLLSGVDQHMRAQMRHLHKAGTASFTLVGFFSRMDAAVRFQVSGPVKSGSADGAMIGFFPCVHRAVTGQVALVAEGRPTELTFVGLVLLPKSKGVQPR